MNRPLALPPTVDRIASFSSCVRNFQCCQRPKCLSEKKRRRTSSRRAGVEQKRQRRRKTIRSRNIEVSTGLETINLTPAFCSEKDRYSLGRPPHTFCSGFDSTLPSGDICFTASSLQVKDESQLVLPKSVYLIGYVSGPLAVRRMSEVYADRRRQNRRARTKRFERF